MKKKKNEVTFGDGIKVEGMEGHIYISDLYFKLPVIIGILLLVFFIILALIAVTRTGKLGRFIFFTITGILACASGFLYSIYLSSNHIEYDYLDYRLVIAGTNKSKRLEDLDSKYELKEKIDNNTYVYRIYYKESEVK